MAKIASSITTTFLALMVSGCLNQPAPDPDFSGGQIDRRSEKLDQIVPKRAELETLGEGYTWPEGPVWRESEQALYFNDVPENTMYRWTAETGATLFLTPSGGGSPDMTAKMREPGANGMIPWPTADDKLLLADHGARGLSLLNLETLNRETLVTQYDGRSLNSPNDLVMRRDGAIYFTDPPYGLRDLNDSPDKELSFNGVYLYQDNAPLKLIVEDLSFPNGIGLSPDEATLYVAVSDPDNPVIMAYDTSTDGSVSNGRVFFDASSEIKAGGGLPDGLDVARNGTIFATGPAGVYVLDPTGAVLGVISTGMPISNCTLNDAETYLYMTSSKVLARIPVNMN